MTSKEEEIERRKQVAISAIKSAYGTEDDEYGSTLFVTHHLEEIETAFWRKHLGSRDCRRARRGRADRVVDIEALHEHPPNQNQNKYSIFLCFESTGVTRMKMALTRLISPSQMTLQIMSLACDLTRKDK